jgi:hypothetical protein
LHARYTLRRINHEEAYSLGGEYGINTNSAESFFSRMRLGEFGHHHHIAGPYLIRFAQESAWREDHRKEALELQRAIRTETADSNGFQIDRIVALAMQGQLRFAPDSPLPPGHRR